MSSNEDEASEILSERDEMSLNEDEASEISREQDELIELLDGNYVKYLVIYFYLDFLPTNPSDATVEIIPRDTNNRIMNGFLYTVRGPAEWERLGVSIGRCSSIYDVKMRKVERGMGIQIDALNPEVYQCIEALYRGLESNNSIEYFELDMDLFPSSGVFPIFNINGAQFKENLKLLSLSSELPIGMNQSLMILPLLESTSLEKFSIDQCEFAYEEAAAFRAIISACTSVQRLHVNFMDTTECATTVATLFRDQRSILTEFNCCENISADNLSIIIDGLTSNTTLKTSGFQHNESLPNFSNLVARSQFERLLCNASSIEGIHNSNHTLIMLQVSALNGIEHFISPLLSDCLELNKNTNKGTVIRTKIARYYFRGEFDISPFVNMDVKLLPKVMGMIEGNAISQRDAIYRLLRGIPDLFTFSGGQPIKRKTC